MLKDYSGQFSNEGDLDFNFMDFMYIFSQVIFIYLFIY